MLTQEGIGIQPDYINMLTGCRSKAVMRHKRMQQLLTGYMLTQLKFTTSFSEIDTGVYKMNRCNYNYEKTSCFIEHE